MGIEKKTIEFRGVELDVEYFFSPDEKAETGPEAQYPGCGEQLELNAISMNGIDCLELLDEQIEKIEELLISLEK